MCNSGQLRVIIITPRIVLYRHVECGRGVASISGSRLVILRLSIACLVNVVVRLALGANLAITQEDQSAAINVSTASSQGCYCGVTYEISDHHWEIYFTNMY